MKTRFILLGLMVSYGLSSMAQYASKGNASYYSDKLHGRRMSNGQKYNRDSMTCAHLKYPLGTLLKVRNPLNGKEVLVEVTDRGPHTKRFIIDLSRAAARELDILRSGFSQVEIVPFVPGESPYRLEDTTEYIPELDLEYQEAATYPNPLWMREESDSIPQNENAKDIKKSTPQKKKSTPRKSTVSGKNPAKATSRK